MIKLVKADLRRIFKRVNVYIYLIILLLAIYLIHGADNAAEQLGYMQNFIKLFSVFLISIPIIANVYGDEFKAGSMQVAIGRGLSRTKIVLAKIFDSFFLGAFYYTILGAIFVTINNYSDVGVTVRQNQLLIIFIVINLIKVVGCVAISGLFMFLAWSVPVGMVLDIFLCVLCENIFQMAQGELKYPIYDYSFYGFLESAYNEIAADNIGFSIVPAILLVAASIAATVIIFKRKELEL